MGWGAQSLIVPGQRRQPSPHGPAATQETACVSADACGSQHSQLQIVGLTPDVPVRPTLDGLRRGRNEVLERAVALLRGGAPRGP
jgi:hypothetical protein